jgi:hypothetical protein
MQRDALAIKHIVPCNWCRRGNQWRTTRLPRRKRDMLDGSPAKGAYRKFKRLFATARSGMYPLGGPRTATGVHTPGTECSPAGGAGGLRRGRPKPPAQKVRLNFLSAQMPSDVPLGRGREGARPAALSQPPGRASLRLVSPRATTSCLRHCPARHSPRPDLVSHHQYPRRRGRKVTLC